MYFSLLALRPSTYTSKLVAILNRRPYWLEGGGKIYIYIVVVLKVSIILIRKDATEALNA